MMTRREAKGPRAIVVPVLGVVLLIACYVVLSEWQSLPGIIGSAVRWPV